MFLFVILCFDADVILSLEKKNGIGLLATSCCSILVFLVCLLMQFVTLYLWVGNENKVEWRTVGRWRAGW